MSTSRLPSSDVRRLVTQSAASFDRELWRRDLLESIAALVVFLIFGEMLDASSWLVRGGALTGMAGSVYIYWRLHRARTRYVTPSVDRPVPEMLRSERAKVDEQIHLLNTVLRWYVGPLACGALLIILGHDGWTWSALVQGVAVLLVSAGVYHLNQRAVRRKFEPRRAELTRLLDRMTEAG